jgi:3',5'-cyclic AMP phosphodiesterase CpdA
MASNECGSLSRRQFLGTTAVAAAVLLVKPPSAWPRVGSEDFSFAVIADTHLGNGKDGVTGEQAWQKALNEISNTDADFVLHLGDLVHTGEKNERLYTTFMDIRKSYKKPVYTIPGNHDPDELFKKYVAEQTDITFDHKGIRFILFDNAHTDSHDGFITDAQLKSLGEQMQGAKDKGLQVIVCMHVAAHTNQRPDVGWYVKPENGQTQFYELLKAHTDSVIAVFSGHFHCGLRGWNDNFGVEEIVFPSACWNVDRGLAKNGPGYAFDVVRTGYALISIKDDKMVLSLKPFGDEPPVVKTYERKVASKA